MHVWQVPEESTTRALQMELWDVFITRDVLESQQGTVITFVGSLQQDADVAFRALKQRFSRHGYTPMLRRQNGEDVIVAVPEMAQPLVNSRPLVHLVLFLATLLTTMAMGAVIAGANPLRNPRELERGAAFAFGLLSILGVHELGHYFVARRHGVAVTLPYFIPVPFGLGTFGAFIQLQSPVENRRALFDVGIAGPLAGTLAAIPLFVIGLIQSRVVVDPGYNKLSASLLVESLVQLVRPHPDGYVVLLHPLALAAWFGLLVTGINLLPAGQLDGGHIAYAVLGAQARWMTLGVLLMLMVMGWLYWPGWYVWALFVALTGRDHPAPLDDITTLDGIRRLWALLGLGTLAITFTPAPF
ncbi:MAG: site-2 protease family protein [Anaerolineae bacterium]|nr:site-2 protease family protein [Anaerolineae bacterium]